MEEEITVGRAAAQGLEQRWGVVRDPVANARVDRLVGAIARASGSPFTFHVAILNSDEPNGIALPGGYIFVTRGLLKLLPEDDLLAAALGHEVAHIALGHMTEMMREQRRLQAGSSNGNREERNRQAGGESRANVTHRREKAADRAAIRYLHAAGVDGSAVVRLLQRLSKQPELSAEGSDTHPSWEDRIRSAEEYLLTSPLGSYWFPFPE